MKTILILVLLFGSFGCTPEFYVHSLNRNYFYHWESVSPQQVDMEIIIHKESNKPRVTEIKFDHTKEFGTGTVMSTTYVSTNKRGRMVVETINPSTLNITQGEYVLTGDTKLLRIVENDTIIFKRRY